ncbi:unnamed protein product, partial [Scytosiphon promiscuus]
HDNLGACFSYGPAVSDGRYEFSEADAACALQAIDSWVESAAHGAQHISPEKASQAIQF